MNYPIWQLGFPGGLLIAIVAVTHVFVSHFAVGGGAFLVVSEARAYRRKDDALLAYVRRHSNFFALLTLVFGAISGVGIWFTIGLVSPEATSSLIHTFVWAWATEWVFFFVEITAALIYAYQWDRLDRATHMAIGWIYFVAAWMSLFVINGIITYQLTPGAWLQTHNIWDGLFNPTYWPSLFLRTSMSVLLAGVFGLLTAGKELGEARERIYRWAGQWMFAGAVLLPACAWWYYRKFPDFSRAYLAGLIPSAQHPVRMGLLSATMILLLALVCGIWKPKVMRKPVIALLVFFAFSLMASGEYLREFVRKPWVINGYIYANGLRTDSVQSFQDEGFAREVKFTATDARSGIAYGQDLFLAQCGSCHAVSGYRSMSTRTYGWDATFAKNMLAHIQMLRGGMPPFAGNEADRTALGEYLGSLNPPLDYVHVSDKLAAGKRSFEVRCGHCHTINGSFRPLNKAFAGSGPDEVKGLFPVLDSMSPNMPPFTGSPEEADLLAQYIAQAANAPMPAAGAKGGK
jgi:mono/diheme cytochrome c family protein